MQKAKSRLKKPPVEKVEKQPAPRSSRSQSRAQTKYWQHLPLLALGLVFYGLMALILLSVQPSSIANFILPQSYLPLQLVFFFGNFFFFSYLSLKTRRGLLMAILLSIGLFLKLQQVSNWPNVSLVFGSVLLSIEVIFSWLESR